MSITTLMPAMRPPQLSLPETRVQFRAVDWVARTLPFRSKTLKLTALGGCAPMFNSQVPFSCGVSGRVFPTGCRAAAAALVPGARGTHSAPMHALTAAAWVMPLRLPANDSVSWLFQLGEGQGPPSRSRTMAPMTSAMQKAATRGTNTSSTRRRVVGAADMRPWYRRILTVHRKFVRGQASFRWAPATPASGRMGRFPLGSEHALRELRSAPVEPSPRRKRLHAVVLHRTR